MAEKSSTDQTGEADGDKNVPPGGSMMVVTVKTPNGKEEITISEDSSVAQVRLGTLFSASPGSGNDATFKKRRLAKFRGKVENADFLHMSSSGLYYQWYCRSDTVVYCPSAIIKCVPEVKPTLLSIISEVS